MKRQQKGFTLIELVVVIVILGILSAFALPRFLDLRRDARIASIEGIGGSIKSASGLVGTACAVDSNCSNAADDALVSIDNLDGPDIQVTNGYAAHSAQGILRAADIGFTSPSNDNTGTLDNSRLSASSTGDGPNALVIEADNAATPSDCSVTYEEPANPGDAPDIVISTSGC